MTNKRFDLKSGLVYEYDKLKGFTLYDPLSYKYNGFDIKSLYEHYLHKRKILEEQEKYYNKLKEFFCNNEIDIGGKDLFDILDVFMSEFFNKVRIIKDGEAYHYFNIDENGYIIKYLRLGGIITQDEYEIPVDIDLGYFKLTEENKIILDKYKEEETWNLG